MTDDDRGHFEQGRWVERWEDNPEVFHIWDIRRIENPATENKYAATVWLKNGRTILIRDAYKLPFFAHLAPTPPKTA